MGTNDNAAIYEKGAEKRAGEIIDIGAGMQVALVPPGWDVTKPVYYNAHPFRQVGTAECNSIQSFVAYVDRFGAPERTLVFMDDKGCFVAYLDGHEPSGKAGWNEHKAVCNLGYSEDFAYWKSAMDKRLNQKTFALLAEDMLHTIARPSADELLTAAKTLRITRQMNFESQAPDNRGTKLHYEVTVKQNAKKGEVVLPDEFDLMVPVFDELAAVHLPVKLRFEVEDGSLSIVLRCPTLPQVLREQRELVREQVRNRLVSGIDVLDGVFMSKAPCFPSSVSPKAGA